jgi:hypothetical protein
MIEDSQLPPELQRLERALLALPREQPSSQLKERCLNGLRAELGRPQSGSRWAFTIAIAASVLLGLNLSLSATQSTDFGLRLDARQQSLEKTAAEIRRLLPDVSPREAARQALLLHSGGDIVPCPIVPTGRVVLNWNLKLAKSDL